MSPFYKRAVSIGDAVRGFLRETGLEKGVDQRRVLFIWDRVVGKKISENTEPLKIERGNLFVKVKNDSWRYNLSFYKREIIKKINKEIGSNVVNKITIR